jgi:PadR family transcriptional regulator PadR
VAKNDLQGTLEPLVVKARSQIGSLHGYGIVLHIQRAFNELLRVQEGSLYPALHRMEQNGWIASEWALTESIRKAKYYKLTAAGRKQLQEAARGFGEGLDTCLQVDDSVATDRFQTVLLSSFGVAALLLALLGVYGVLAYSVSLRQQEFGIRMALGSGKSALVWLVVGQAAKPVLSGIVAGLALSFASTRWIESLLYQTKIVDLTVISVTVGVLLGAAFLAAVLPARRAASVDPIDALRTE